MPPMRRNAVRYQWEDEPPERRSEFIPSTGYSQLSSFNTPSEPRARSTRTRQRSGWGLKGVIAVVAALLGVCGYVMHEVVKLLGS